jgi:choloylglycine hydrolase
MRSSLTRYLGILCALAALSLPVSTGSACTSFLLKHPAGPLMAKNFDWDVADGLVIINPRGLAKTAVVAEGQKPVRWTSRYGSISFNQYGREFPIGGMNEAGLAIEALWLAETVYPPTGERRSISTLQWIQYCLDSFRSVAEVVASAAEVAVTGQAPLHFLACDATANCAVIEFLEGALVSRSDRTLPLPVLTNHSFAESLNYLNRTLGYGGEPIKPEGHGSLARFARTARGTHAARTAASDHSVKDSFGILADVAQPGSTQWSIVYELQTTTVHFTSSGNSEIRSVSLGELELDCTDEPMMLDLLAEGAGDMTTKLLPYSAERNLETIKAGFTADSLDPPAPELIESLAAYPDGLTCTFQAGR